MLALLPETIRPRVQSVVDWVTALSRPAKVFLGTTLLAAVLLAGYVSVRSANPPYAVLFTNLDKEDAAQVVAKLKEMKVPYRLEGDGAIIEVPESQARELRLELAGAGLPRGGSVGFETFDKSRIGATEFEQRVLYRRALEGELSRTIGSVGAVEAARVHLVLPEKSVFVSRAEPASASIVVKLHQGRVLGAGEIGSIVHLVAASVPGLTPDRVALVSTEGIVLHKPRRPGDETGADDERATQARSLEATLEERARTFVEKLVGQGHVDVRVTAELDATRMERVEDRYDPKTIALRSEERTVEHSAEEGTSATGVPGAESNLPTGAARAAGGADGGAPQVAQGPLRESHTRNFEVDHVVEKRFVSAGQLRRLTVAVVVDGSPITNAPRSPEEMAKISSLVRSAVGASDARGDLVTVESVPFIAAPIEIAPPPAPAAFDLKKRWPFVAGGAGAFAIASIVLIVRARRRRKAEAAAAELAAKAAAALLPPVDATTSEAPPELETPDLRQLVNERASADPATAALVLRAWLGDQQTEGAENQAA